MIHLPGSVPLGSQKKDSPNIFEGFSGLSDGRHHNTPDTITNRSTVPAKRKSIIIRLGLAVMVLGIVGFAVFQGITYFISTFGTMGPLGRLADIFLYTLFLIAVAAITIVSISVWFRRRRSETEWGEIAQAARTAKGE